MEVNGTIFVQIFIFLTLLLWLSRALFAPILKLFDERERLIEGAKTDAARMQTEAKEKEETFALEFEKAKSQARKELNAQKNELEKEHNAMFAELKSEVRSKLDQADKERLGEEVQVREQLSKASDLLAQEILKALRKKNKEGALV